MNKRRKRYRVRTEWNGVEVFDRQEGRIFSIEQESTEKILEQAEPLINTPYPKTPDFASAPRRIYWELTRACNLNCKTCFNRVPTQRSELFHAEIIALADQFYRAGVYELRLTGGEPTIRPNFFKLVSELHNMGFYLSIGTNGVYSKTTLRDIMKAPLDWIIVSLDGSDEATHREIRGSRVFEQVLHTLECLATKGCRLRVNTLIRKTNYTYEHLKGLAEICDRFHVESLNCIPMRPVSNNPETKRLQLTAGEFKEFITGLNRLRQEHVTDFVTTLDLRHTSAHDLIYFKDHSCAAGREGTVVSPHGDIYGCSYSPASIPDASRKIRDRYVAGNLLDQDFLEIWNHSERWAIYRDLKTFKHDTCKRCHYYITKRCIGNCPIMDQADPSAFDPYCYLHLL